MGTAMFQQLAMLFEPKGHEQSSPFMLLQVQTNAMPGVEISKGKSNDWLIAVFSLVFGFVILALIMIKMLKKSQQKLQPKEETFSEPNTATALMEDI
jgi:flagellar biosynthesis/type III secretory pathway M-ring protein FliF/YscJ